MLKSKELFHEAISLPIEMRMKLVEKLMCSLNPIHNQIDKLWAKEAEKRVREIKKNKVKTISGEKVFERIRDRLSS